MKRITFDDADKWLGYLPAIIAAPLVLIACLVVLASMLFWPVKWFRWKP